MDSAQRRIMTEFSALTKEHRGQSQVASIRFLDESDMFTWRLQLKNFDNDCEGGRNLNADLARLAAMCGQDHIDFEIRFPKDYPNAPFFCRVISPRCVMYTGHVTAGGSICLEMLTQSGTPGSWQPSITVSGVLVVILNNMVNCDVAHITTLTGPGGRTGPLRVDFSTIYCGRVSTYSEQEAKSAFSRMMMNHQRTGWNSGVDAVALARVFQPPKSTDSDKDSMTATHADPGQPTIAGAPTSAATSQEGAGQGRYAAFGSSSVGASTLRGLGGASPSGRSQEEAPDTGRSSVIRKMVDMLNIDSSLASAILKLKNDNVDDAVAWYFENGDGATEASVNSLISQRVIMISSDSDEGVCDLCSSDGGDMDMSDGDMEGSDDDARGNSFDDSDDGFLEDENHKHNMDVSNVADVTGLAKKDAEELLKCFDGNVGDALEQWMNDEVSLREVLNLIPCEREKHCACIVKSTSIHLNREQEKLEALLLRQPGRGEEEAQALAASIEAAKKSVATWQKSLAMVEADLRKAQHERGVASVPGDIYQRRISKLADTWIWRVPSIETRPVYTRTREQTSLLYTIHAGQLDTPQERYHFSYVKAQFDRSFGSSTDAYSGVFAARAGPNRMYTVTKVEVNENPEVEARYRAKRKQFFDEGKSVAEELVFHGTPDARIMDQICAEGFEIGGSNGVAIRHGAANGNGVYVARQAGLSISYAGGTRQLLLCKCAVGSSVKSTGYHYPTTSSSKPTFDCLDRGDALILQSKAQVLPKYIVYYS